MGRGQSPEIFITSALTIPCHLADPANQMPRRPLNLVGWRGRQLAAGERRAGWALSLGPTLAVLYAGSNACLEEGPKGTSK